MKTQLKKNYDLIYFIGDSWTVADNTDNVLPKPQPRESLFSHIVAEYFDIPYKVNAVGGVGNEWIHRTVIDDLEKYIAEDKKILLIVGWSDPSRREIYYKIQKDSHTLSENVCDVEWHKEYVLNHFNYDFQVLITRTLIKGVRSFCHAFDIDYIESFAFTEVLEIPFLNKNHVLNKNWGELCGNEGKIYNPKTRSYGHQNKIGQQIIAKALIDKIKEIYGSN